MPVEPLRFKRLVIHEVAIPFRFRFRHAAAERRMAESLILELEAEDGTKGFGECIPRSYVTGESLQSAVKDLKELWWPKVKALCLDVASPRETLLPIYGEADELGRTAGYAGIDIAVFDCWARYFKVPGGQLFGIAAKPEAKVRLTAPIGLGRGSRFVAYAYMVAGFRNFKAKVGDSEDVARLGVLRRTIGFEPTLTIDANGIWTYEQALAKLTELGPLDITTVEQPLAKADIVNLAKLARATGLPMRADESLCNRRDAEALAKLYDGIQWNIRLAKVGGFSGALALIERARALGIRYQLGAMVGETSLLTAALRALLPIAEPVMAESSFPRVLLTLDPFDGGPAAFSSWALPLGAKPGLGVKLRRESLTRHTVGATRLD